MHSKSVCIHWIGLGIVATVGGCKSNGSADPSEEVGGSSFVTGGSSGVGGNNSWSGGATTAQGGSSASQVSSGVGGATNQGGASSRGGAGGTATSAGGSSNGGITSAGGNGGASNLGGSAYGGTSNIGGSSPRGGAGGTAASSLGGSAARGGSSGTAGMSQGGAATGGMVATGGLWRGPTPASTSAKFPFPQNRQSANCVYPKDYRNEDVQSVYNAWKTDLVTADGAGGFRRVKRPSEPGLEVNSTVSEGIAYGMVIAVYMNDQALFDDLWKYALLHTWTDGGGKQTILMNWYVLSNGNLGNNGSGAAIDADEDMAWGLVMADKQWGGKGSLSKSYLDYAKQLLADIWTYEIHEGKLPKNGSTWGDWNSLNISYFAPAFYRVFANVSGNTAWSGDVVKCVYDTIDGNLTSANGNQTNGLVPAFSTTTGGDAWVSAGQSPLRHDYQYDSCRTPFRIGLDACLFNDKRARDYVAKTSQFFAGIGAANIKDGYALNGNPTPEFGTSRGFQGRSAAFVGPAGVGAMHSSSYQSFVDEVWGLIRQNNMWCGGQYYDESWTMLTMLMMSGNFLDYTVETPK